MNILILSWRDTLHPLAGGAEQSLFEHAKYWVKKGANVTWIASKYSNSPHKEIMSGVSVIRIGSQFTVHLLTLIGYRNLVVSADIVIDSFHFIPFFTPLYIQRHKIIALINEPAKEAWFKNIFFPASLLGYLVEPIFFKLYKNIPFITSANSIMQELIELGISKKDITIIPHGVTTNKTFKKFKKESIPTILYLAQISRDKGIEDAIATIKVLKQRKIKVNFMIAGKPTSQKYTREIKSIIEDFDIKSRTKYYGFVSLAKKFELLQRAWILIHPSIREGWGLNVIEANTFGTPAVGYNVAGLRDSIKDNKTGLLAPKNTPVALAELCSKLIENKNLYCKLSENSKKWSMQFKWENAGGKSWELVKNNYEQNQK